LRYKRKITVFIALLRFFATFSDCSANVSKSSQDIVRPLLANTLICATDHSVNSNAGTMLHD
jgi:hypothetical protein